MVNRFPLAIAKVYIQTIRPLHLPLGYDIIIFWWNESRNEYLPARGHYRDITVHNMRSKFIASTELWFCCCQLLIIMIILMIYNQDVILDPYSHETLILSKTKANY